MTSEKPETRSIRLEVEVPGTPEQVWEAIATGPGISAWFVPSEVAQHDGGELTMTHGPGMVETGRITAFEPPRRFACVAPVDGERQLAYEWLVEAQAGGTCIVRLVNSGFGVGADWDGEYDAMTSGWRMFLECLRLHLAHFAGQPCRPILASAAAAGPPERGWRELADALGIEPDAGLGDRIATRSGPQTLAGTVEWARLGMRLLLLDSPSPGVAFVGAEGSGPDRAYLSVWIYPRGDGIDENAWHTWMAERFSSPAPV
jgi:uncharacterized protein YndB with AHSA1/START domain